MQDVYKFFKIEAEPIADKARKLVDFYKGGPGGRTVPHLIAQPF